MKALQVIRGGIVLELQAESGGGYTISVPSLLVAYPMTFALSSASLTGESPG